jgi:hypothetical protein
MTYWKILCGAGFLLALISNLWSISEWTEARGVYDDICYLRQAHLFHRFGLGGLNTDISRDDDHFLAEKLKEIGFPSWRDAKTFPCHTSMAASGKLVTQYPPGTGFALALFPVGLQVIPIYVLASLVAFGFAVSAIRYASTLLSLMLVAVFGDAAIYLMINPTKASYSMAPTMMICALAGFLTAKLFITPACRTQILVTAAVGLLIGLAVNFRLPNLFLSAGYLLFFVGSLLARKRHALLQAALFGGSFLAGMVPTLLANAINAGSAFSTTYGEVDVKAPELNAEVIWSYVTDFQFVLLVVAGAWAAMMWRHFHYGARQVALVTAGNLVVNLAFFMTHPVVTPYYTIPVAMLSLWSLLFATLMQPTEAVDDLAIAEAARA